MSRHVSMSACHQTRLVSRPNQSIAGTSKVGAEGVRDGQSHVPKQASMSRPFISKLKHGAHLEPKDEETLGNLARPAISIDARSDIVADGDEPRSLPLILDGLACRYKVLENGKRQITRLFIPGDLCQPFGVLLRFMDHSLGALTRVVFSPVSLNEIGDAARANTRIQEALWWDLLTSLSLDREHKVSLGRRSASERVGHLFCELYNRLGMVGLIDGKSYDMPVTQADLSDLLGLSPVHVNRSLQELRKSGLISLSGRKVTIHDLGSLREFSFFDQAYLQASGSRFLQTGSTADG
jgi:CRP-like cAMP-binding protein